MKFPASGRLAVSHERAGRNQFVSQRNRWQ